MQNSIVALSIAMVMLLPRPLAADDPDLKKQLESILVELQRIRMILECGQQNANVQREAKRISLNVRGAPHLGSLDAPLTIVQFTDYECPFCKQFFRQTLADIRRHYIDSQKARFNAANIFMRAPIAESPQFISFLRADLTA
jgi:Thioredoxin